MGTFGKILIFFNILLGAGVAYLAAQSWALKQDQSAIALRHYMVINGLPLEAEAIPEGASEEADAAFPFIMPGRNQVESVRVGLLKAHFQGTESSPYASPTPPNSRMEELKRVRAKFETQLVAKKPAEKLSYLVGFTNPATQIFTPGLLIYLANSFDERQALKQLLIFNQPTDLDKNAKEAEQLALKRFDALLIAGAPANDNSAEKAAVEALQTSLNASRATVKTIADARAKALADSRTAATARDAKAVQDAFDADAVALENLRTENTKMLKIREDLTRLIRESAASASFDQADRMIRLTSLLMLIDYDAPTDAWQKRVALVVGLKDYLAAIIDRTERLADHPNRFSRLQSLATSEFIETYENLKAIALDRDRLLDRQLEITRALAEQSTKETDLAAQRKTQRDTAEQDFLKVQTSINEAAAAQSIIEADLFEIQKKVGGMLRNNFKLEEDIEAAERAKLPGR